MKTSKAILDPNLGTFVQMIADAVKQGWELDDQFPPALYGFYYECRMVRDESIVDPPAKMTMQEIAALGRATKAAKKAAKEAEAKKEEAAPEPVQEPEQSTEQSSPESEEGTQTSDEQVSPPSEEKKSEE